VKNLKIKNWTNCIQDCKNWKLYVEKAKTFKELKVVAPKEEEEIQIQTKLDQPSGKNGQHQNSETRPQLQSWRKKRLWAPQETMATRRCQNRSSDLMHGGRRRRR
jgi:hypothetical protein